MKRSGAQQWLDEAFRALAASGIDSVRVEKLAKQLHVTKGSFYWHFENREALLAAMLVHWETSGTLRIIEVVDAATHDPKERLRTLMQIALHQADKQEASLDARMRAWASTDTNAAQVLSRVDKRRLNYVKQLLKDLQVPDATFRAGMLYRMLIGEYTWRVAGNTRASQAFVNATVELLTQSG